MEVDLLHFPSLKTDDKITIITQPGMRYAQANALVNSLLLDNKFNNLSAIQRKNIIERILSKN